MVINCGAPENIGHVRFNRIIPKGSDSVPMRNQDMFNSRGLGERSPARPAEGSQIARNAPNFNMGPGVHISVYVTSAKSF